MTAGLPGSGIGGFFYLLSAFLMPVKESVSLWRRESSSASRRTVCRQMINAAGVFCGVWLTGWFIARAVEMVSQSMHFSAQRGFTVIAYASLVYGLVTLLGVFLFIQVLSWLLRKAHPGTKPFART